MMKNKNFIYHLVKIGIKLLNFYKKLLDLFLKPLLLYLIVSQE